MNQDDPPATGPAICRATSLARARVLSQILFDEGGLIDADAALSKAGLQALKASGLGLAILPAASGGEGLIDRERYRDLSDVLRLLGAGDLSFGRLFEGHVNAVTLVDRYGTPAQSDLMAGLARDGGLSAVWNAEGRRPLTATMTATGWRLEGEKILCSGAGRITRPIVPARSSDGIVMLLPTLRVDTPVDVSAWTPQGMRATATGTVDFSGLIVPENDQIGEIGDYLRQPVFSGGAWRFCAVHLGAAERLVDLFRGDLLSRGRAEDPYQKQRVAQCVAAVVTARQWVEQAARLASPDSAVPEEVVSFVNLTRTVTERACLDVIETVQRGMGLKAFVHPDPVERVARDLSTYLRQPVPDAAMADAAATVLASGVETFDLWRA